MRCEAVFQVMGYRMARILCDSSVGSAEAFLWLECWQDAVREMAHGGKGLEECATRVLHLLADARTLYQNGVGKS